MTIDIAFIHPGAQQALFGPLANFTALEPPTWTRMLAGYCRDRGAAIAIIDAEADELSPAAVAELVEHLNPRLTVIVVQGHQPSSSSQQMVGAGQAARAIKAKNPHLTILMTGNHPSALPERTLAEELVDFVADGEGAATIMSLLDNLECPGWGNVPGLVYRVTNTVLRNPTAPLIEDLDRDLHGDVWYSLPMNRYRAHTWHAMTGPRRPYASVYTTLGCPHKCSFCMINSIFHGNRYRRFSPAFVVNQIAFLYHSYGVRSIKVADEMFILNESHYTQIAEGLIAAGLHDLNLWAYARVDTVRPETLNLLRRAGFKWLALGIESGSKYVRDGANKRLRNDDIVDVVKTVQAAGIHVVGNFIFGLPDDTFTSMQETLDLALACLPEHANFYGAMAYPGSALYTQATAKNWTLPTSWSGYSQHSQDSRPLDTDTVTGPEVRAFRDSAWQTYFTHPAYLASIEQKFGADARAAIEAQARIRLR
jgi:radical SAM superfamily enzyme YgiQ (UPF0313 family)